ncbi:MAG TPA: ISNCY family transposase, partial [Dehalococcoidia bacterium]|nr:ISNCY family transposase [Dehalococcoidia bacterium]
ARALDVGTAAGLLGVSPRQVRRLRARFHREGFGAVLHGNVGRVPANHTDPALVGQILALAGPEGKYEDFNVCHLQELLGEQERIKIGRSSLDRMLKQAGLRHKAGTSRPVHRRKRLRRSAEGMLLQIDGSPFDWLEGRGPKADLIGAIDDATGKVVFLHFRLTEDQTGYLLLLRTVAQSYGLPMSIYHDRHTILRSPKQPTLEEELAGQLPMSQIQRVMAELGIESIPAYSPQAKGRIERLWGTLQDRLTKELRIAGITTLEEANAFLPGFIGWYNLRFAKVPQDPNTAWVPLPPELDLNYYFAIRETRKVRADHCISWSGQLLQLLPGPKEPSLVDKRVVVHVVPEGDIYVYYDRHRVAYRPVLVSDPVPLAPTPKPIRQPRLANPKAKARQRAWLFAQG